MRIVQVTDTLQPGGAERVAVDLSNFLASIGHEVFFCVTRKKGALEAALNPEISLTCLNRTSTFAGLRKFRKYITQNRIRIIHAHGNNTAQFCVVALVGITNVKIIHHDHNSVLKKRNWLLERIVLGRVSHWIVVSMPIFHWAKIKVGYKNLSLILNPINTKRFIKCSNQLSQPVKVIALANYRVEKYYENLIAIGRLVKEQSLRVVFVCYGSHFGGEYFLKIKSLCETDHLQDIIQLNPPTMQIPELLKNANLGVLFSKSEGLPISLLEYMATSLPVVVTDVGDCGEIVRTSGCGKVVPVNNPEAFLSAIKNLIESPDRLTIGANGRRYVDQYHSIEYFGSQIVNEVYKKV